MAKNLEVSVDLDKDVDTVFEALCSAEYIKSKLEAAGCRNINVQQSGTNGSSATLVYDREEKADVPSALKKFVKEWNHTTNRDNWKGSAGGEYRCEYTVDMSGPIKVGGIHTLVPNGSGTTSKIVTTISCGIPLVGKKLEEFVAGMAEGTLQHEGEFQKKYIDG